MDHPRWILFIGYSTVVLSMSGWDGYGVGWVGKTTETLFIEIP